MNKRKTPNQIFLLNTRKKPLIGIKDEENEVEITKIEERRINVMGDLGKNIFMKAQKTEGNRLGKPLS